MPIHEPSIDTPRTEQENRARFLSALNTVTTLLGGTLDPNRVLDYIAMSLLELTQADGGAVLLYPENGAQTLEVASSAGEVPLFIDGLPPILLLSDRAFSDQQPFSPTNVATDSHAFPIREMLLDQGFLGLIELPLLNGTDLLGEMIAYFRHPIHFNEEEIEFLRIFTNQAGLSINHARMHNQMDQALQQRIAQITALSEINQELAATLDPQNLFELVLDRAILGTASDSGALLLRPGRPSDPMQVVAQRGADVRRTAEILQRPTIFRSLANNEVTVEFNGPSELSVPISREGDILGVIALQGHQMGGYKPQDVEFVRQIANQALIAIDNARLFRHIEESRNRLQVILDSMREAVLLLDTEGNVLIANPQITNVFGIRADQMTGKNFRILLTEPRQRYARLLGFTSDALRKLIDRMGGGDIPDVAMYHTYRIDQPAPRYIERTLVPTTSLEGDLTGLLMVFSDVTKEHEEAQAREELSHMIVHDLRSPLTAISTSLKLLTEIDTEDKVMQIFIERTTDASQRALRKVLNLVDSILDIAKMEGGSMVLSTAARDIHPLVENVYSELMPIAAELEVTMDTDLPADLPLLNADTPKIERVLLNLVDNALKFVPLNGHIQVRGRTIDNHWMQVEVRDTGPGIPDEYKSRIFDRYQQVDSATGRRRGTGLGLTFCKLTVEAHGGRIWIEDNPGGGSVFAFTLPIIVG